MILLGCMLAPCIPDDVAEARIISRLSRSETHPVLGQGQNNPENVIIVKEH